MAISNEFRQAVHENNMLRVKIMLKDSLSIDKTFQLFDEMSQYATENGANPWDDASIPLERAAEPWSEDTLNSELASLIEEFTRERVAYVQDIIRAIYKQPSQARQQDGQTKPTCEQSPPTRRQGNPARASSRQANGSTMSFRTPTDKIIKNGESIGDILYKYTASSEAQGGMSGKGWSLTDIKNIRNYALRIVRACDEMLKTQ